VLNIARKKLVEALLENKSIIIKTAKLGEKNENLSDNIRE